MACPSARSRPTESHSQALNIEYPTPRYGYERHTEVLEVHLLDTAQAHHGACAQGIPDWNSSTKGVRITQNWRWGHEHLIELRGDRTIEVPAGSTVRFTRTARPGSPQHTPSPQPSGSQPAAFVPQLSQTSGSQPDHEDASHSPGTQSVPGPTPHDASTTPIDRRGGARHNARRAQGASSSTPPVTPDDRWRCGANGHANAEANEAFGTPDRERVLEILERYERYAEPNPPVDRAPGSPSSISISTLSSSTTVEGGQPQPLQPQADPFPPLDNLKLIAEDGTMFYIMAASEASHIQEYYQLHPDRARPHHRTAQPLRPALRGASRNENRDDDGDAGGALRSRLCRPPGRYDFGNEEFVIPPLPSPRQQHTPPNDDDDDGDSGSESRAPQRGAHTHHSRGMRSLLKRVRRTVFPCTATRTPVSSRSRNTELPSRPWRREQVHARPLPEPPVVGGIPANGVHPGYYGVPNQGFLPPVSIYPFGHLNYGLTNCPICRHPASHHLDCPALRQPTLAPPPSQQARDPVGNRSASRATQREERRERHNRSPEDRRHAHRSRRHQAENADAGLSRTPIDADATAAPASTAASAPQEPPLRGTDRAGQIGNYVEGSPARLDYWTAPPIVRTQSTPAPDESPAPVVPSPPQRHRQRDLALDRSAVLSESEARRHRRHRQRDAVTDVPVIPNTIPDNASSRSSNSSSRDRSTLNTQLATPPPSREPSPNTPTSENVPIPPPPPQPVPAVWAQPMIPAGFPFPAMFPAIAWVPHPQPHPTIPAATFWQLPRGFPRVPTPAVASMTGGWPLPGTAAGTWKTPSWPLPVPLVRTPSAASASSLPRTPARQAPQLAPDLNGPRPIICPYLIPNPGNPSVPWLDWDIRMPPSLAKRYTARETVMPSISDKLGEVATHPPVPRLEVVYTTAVPALLNYWGAIPVDKGEGSTVTMGDVLDAVHDFFQVPLTHQEAVELKQSHTAEWRAMSSAFKKRCRDYPALVDVTWRQGMRRVDALTDRYKWWGMWVHWNPDGTWYLNLGLVPKHPPR